MARKSKTDVLPEDPLQQFASEIRSKSRPNAHPGIALAWRFVRGVSMFTAMVFVLSALVVTVGSVTQKWRVVPLLSGSMAPEIDTGDAVILVPVPRGELELNDVIAFTKEGAADKRPTIHRIIDIAKLDGGKVIVQTKGDANEIPDQEGVDESGNPLRMSLNSEQVWKVQDNLRNVGWIMLEMAKPRTWFAILGLIGLAVVISSFKNEEGELEPVPGTQSVGRAEPLLPHEVAQVQQAAQQQLGTRPEPTAEERFGAMTVESATESFS
jgi:signal peptidase I